MSLTGRFNFSKSWRGKLTLEVEEIAQPRWGGEKRRWRRATLSDLAEPEMRALIDLRFKPQFFATASSSPLQVPGTITSTVTSLAAAQDKAASKGRRRPY